jgi:hypothetical protein
MRESAPSTSLPPTHHGLVPLVSASVELDEFLHSNDKRQAQCAEDGVTNESTNRRKSCVAATMCSRLRSPSQTRQACIDRGASIRAVVQAYRSRRRQRNLTQHTCAKTVSENGDATRHRKGFARSQQQRERMCIACTPIMETTSR